VRLLRLEPGARPAYREAAEEMARALAARGLGLVYGGASVGLMGALADAALGAGAEVPRALVEREIAHAGLSELHVVESMHERKALMADLSDGFVALPGGAGTLEELFEVWTWAQLGLHLKPCGLLDVEGYYGGLAAFLDHAVAERFLTAAHREILMLEEEPGGLLDSLATYEPPRTGKWIDRGEDDGEPGGRRAPGHRAARNLSVPGVSTSAPDSVMTMLLLKPRPKPARSSARPARPA
jgi:uncharacterized protein (TIGR00730 family)